MLRITQTIFSFSMFALVNMAYTNASQANEDVYKDEVTPIQHFNGFYLGVGGGVFKLMQRLIRTRMLLEFLLLSLRLNE